ncbi:MAG: hypothetical protein WC236_15030 [Gallionellaceae bacterium]
MQQHTENIADAAVLVWEQMAAQIILLVGECGFQSLYTRSIYLTQPAYPWLEDNVTPCLDNDIVPPSLQAQHHFSELKRSFEGKSPAQTGAANSLLLLNFTDVLTSLIGEALTISILRSVCDAKEVPHMQSATGNHGQ